MSFIKIINYFFFRPLNNVLILIINNFKGKYFAIFFNMYSFFSLNFIYLSFENNFFKLKYKSRYWYFAHRSRAWIYLKGLKYRSKELFEEYILKSVPIKTNDYILDCGANVGDFYLCFNKKINYIGIEPSLKEFKCLNKNIKNQKLINKALWNKSKKIKKFYVSSEEADSSLIKINNYENTVMIKTITLDEIVKKLNRRIKLLKLEAEGAEPEVLEGFKKYIGLVDYISIDAGFERGKKLESTIVKCSNFLVNNNFKMIGYTHSRVIIIYKNRKLKN